MLLAASQALKQKKGWLFVTFFLISNGTCSMVNHLHRRHGSDSCSVCPPGQAGLGNVGPHPILLHGSISVKMKYFAFTPI